MRGERDSSNPGSGVNALEELGRFGTRHHRIPAPLWRGPASGRNGCARSGSIEEVGDPGREGFGICGGTRGSRRSRLDQLRNSRDARRPHRDRGASPPCSTTGDAIGEVAMRGTSVSARRSRHLGLGCSPRNCTCASISNSRAALRARAGRPVRASGSTNVRVGFHPRRNGIQQNGTPSPRRARRRQQLRAPRPSWPPRRVRVQRRRVTPQAPRSFSHSA